MTSSLGFSIFNFFYTHGNIFFYYLSLQTRNLNTSYLLNIEMATFSFSKLNTEEEYYRLDVVEACDTNAEDTTNLLNEFLLSNNLEKRFCREVVLKNSIINFSNLPDFGTPDSEYIGLHSVVYEDLDAKVRPSRKIIRVPKFSHNRYIQSIVIGKNYIEVGNYTFAGCISLTSVTLPDSLEYIGQGAFEGYTYIDHVFTKNESWTSVCIPTGVRAIGHFAFNENSNLEVHIKNREGVVHLGEHAVNRPPIYSNSCVSQQEQSLQQGQMPQDVVTESNKSNYYYKIIQQHKNMLDQHIKILELLLENK